MSLRRAFVGAAVLVTIALTGCSASGGDDAGTEPAVSKTAAAAPKADAGDGAVDVANAPVSAEALCAYLKKDSARIKAVGSEVGAQAQLTMGIADLYGDHLDKLDGDVVDAQALKTCPATRAELLKAAGLKSFGEL
jgi:hypothetical protein